MSGSTYAGGRPGSERAAKRSGERGRGAAGWAAGSPDPEHDTNAFSYRPGVLAKSRLGGLRLASLNSGEVATASPAG
jgi:hypothetical protein